MANKQQVVVTDPKIALVMRIFDWFSDGENFEVDNRNRACFSLERLRRELKLEATELNEAIQLLKEKTTMLGQVFSDPIRERKLYPIDPQWVRGKNRDLLQRILTPQPVTPHVPFGPARVLRTVHVPIDGQIFTFKANDIVRDEAKIIALRNAGGVIAKLEDTSATACLNKSCYHIFDLSEALPVEHPVFESLKRDLITFRDSGFMLSLEPGDWVTERLHCEILRREHAEQIKNGMRELTPDEFVCCPKCRSISKRESNLRLEKNIEAKTA